MTTSLPQLKSAPSGEASASTPSAGPAAKPQHGFGEALHHVVHHHHAHHAHHSHHQRHHAPHEVALSPKVEAAVDEAIEAEHVSPGWRNSLLFIAAQESSGHVGARNNADSARGLFQLTRASWHLNPNGAASFGNAREEAQGGIRYIEARYTTALSAESFWRLHHWY